MFLHVNYSEKNNLKLNIYKLINFKLLKNPKRNFKDFLKSVIVLLDTSLLDINNVNFIIDKIDTYCGFKNANIIDVVSTWKITTDDLKYYGFILRILYQNKHHFNQKDLSHISQLLLVLNGDEYSTYLNADMEIQLSNMSCNDYFIEIIELISKLFNKEYFYQNITEMNSELDIDSYLLSYLEHNFSIGYKDRPLTIDEIKDLFPDMLCSYIENVKDIRFIKKLQTYLESLSSFIFIGSFDEKLFITLDDYYSDWNSFIDIKVIALIFIMTYSNSEYINY